MDRNEFMDVRSRFSHSFNDSKGRIARMLAVLLGFFLFIPALPLMAQTTSSTITGFVSDGNNPVPNAVVTVLHESTGTVYYAISNNKGIYLISNILSGGPYTIRVERLNYVTQIVKGVDAPLGEAVVVDVVVSPSRVRLEEVTIYDELNSAMNINRSGVGVHVDNKGIEALPNVNRSLGDVLRLVPQSIVTESGQSIGGGNYRGSSVSVDGAGFNNAFGIGSSLPAGGTPISLEAISQLDVNITPFNVRHSGFLGSSINIVTKHGTNKWNGSVYDYFTNSDLQGQKAGDNLLATPRTLNNTIGMTLGGPIVKNKLFFFLNGEYTTDHDAGAERQARPDESYSYGGSTGYCRPTVAQMDAIQQFLNDRFGYNPGRYQNYTHSSPDYKLFGRLDWRIDDYNTFLIRVSHTHVSTSNEPSNSMSPMGGTNTYLVSGGENYTLNRYSAGRTSPYALPFESSRYYQYKDFTTVAAELNSRMMNERASNMARITWSLQNEPRSFVGGLFPTVDILAPYTDDNGQQQMAVLTTFGPDPFAYGNLCRVNTITATDEYTYKTGIHSILGGVQIEWNRIVNGYMQGGAGWYVYDSWQSFVDDVNGADGAGPALFMMTHANTSTPAKQVFPTFDHSQVSLYAQDEMDFSKYFKLTVGLRLEAPFVRYRYDNRNVEFDEIAAANPNSSFAGLSTADLPHVDFHVSPRVGFNWDVTKKRTVILRGGTGLFTGRIPNVWLVSAVGNANCLQYQYIANTVTGLDVVRFDTDQEAIINNIYSGHAYEVSGLPAPTNATILAKDLRMPRAWKTSLAVDVLIPGGVKATFEGVYSINLNEIYASILGYKEDGTVQLPGEPDARAHYASEDVTNKAGARMSGYYLHNEKGLHGQYLALTAQLTKEFHFGLSLMAAYTYSYAQNLSDGVNDQISSFANTYCVNDCNRPELGYSGFVAPHRVIASIGYTIKEGERTATHLGCFYDGLNIGVYNYNYTTRYSYLIRNVSGLTSPQLMYIPTAEELASMPFSSEDNREAFESFIQNDPYLSKHRGEYSKRNGGKAPWLNRINFKVSQEFYFNVSGRRQTLDVGVDFQNIGNLLSPKWGTYKVLDNDVVLQYQNGSYTFTPNTWSVYNNLSSTWRILVHVKYAF